MYTPPSQVQGVYFRKHTQATAQGLGLVGWVKNTPHGTVVGEAHGPSTAIADFQTWLKTTGSPSSRIDKAEFHVSEAPAGGAPCEFQVIRRKKA